MSASLSVDLRQRVVRAVAAGASWHGAAARFGVSLASASRWCGQFARDGHVAPKPMGGDQRSHRVDLRTSGATTADEMRKAVEASLRNLMGPEASAGPLKITVEIVDKGAGCMNVRLKWPAGG